MNATEMGYLHAVAALALAAYLYQVWDAGNAPKLYEMVASDLPGFLRWGLASAILLWLTGRMLGSIGIGLGALIVVSVALKGGPEIIEGIEMLTKEAA